MNQGKRWKLTEILRSPAWDILDSLRRRGRVCIMAEFVFILLDEFSYWCFLRGGCRLTGGCISPRAGLVSFAFERAPLGLIGCLWSNPFFSVRWEAWVVVAARRPWGARGFFSACPCYFFTLLVVHFHWCWGWGWGVDMVAVSAGVALHILCFPSQHSPCRLPRLASVNVSSSLLFPGNRFSWITLATLS
ncbi:hypothetical protein JB92DRAFT_1471043 [Gautieria morchelliformis]|nr:hypothetical protein JB92DRAFT_1471043 [Gautieria morchelliformis]